MLELSGLESKLCKSISQRLILKQLYQFVSQGAIPSTKIRERQFVARIVREHTCFGIDQRKGGARHPNRVSHASRFFGSSNAIRYIYEEPFSDTTETDDFKKDFGRSSVASRETPDPERLVGNSVSPTTMTVQVANEDHLSDFENVRRKQRNQKQKQQSAENVEIQACIRYIDGGINQMPARGDVY